MKKLYHYLKLLTVLTVFLSARAGYSQCATTFSYGIGAGGVVSFTANSSISGTITGYNWNFGNSSTVSGPTLAVTSTTYLSNGTYTVNLIVTAAPSCTAISTQTLVISNATPPCSLTANAAYTPSANGFVSFNNLSSGTSSTTSYTWLFGDGSPTTSVTSPAHTYSANGSYTITLFATNNYTPSTCTSTYNAVVTITNACNISPAFSLTPGANGTVFFQNATTGTTTGTTYSISWGDGSPVNYAASHTYSSNGAFIVTLIAYGSPSAVCNGSVSHGVTVTSVCNLAANFTLVPMANGYVGFTNMSTGTTAATTYTLAWGDGAIGGSNPHHYTNGAYTCTLYASNSSTAGGCSADTTRPIVVSNACTLAAGFSLTAGSNGNVTLNNSSTGTTSAAGYTINWGDGTANSSSTHQYTANSTYTVTLHASNNPTIGTCADSTQHAISIINYCAPMTPAFSYSTGLYGQVTFYSASTGTTALTNYSWSYVTYPAGSGVTNFSSGSSSATETFTANGGYAVTLTIYNPSTPTCSYSITHTLNISNAIPPCTAAFTYTVGSAYTVSFTSAYASPSGSTHYSWHFGDSTSGVGHAPVHTYPAGGTYYLHMTVKDTITWQLCSASQSIVVFYVPCSFTAALSHTVGTGGSVVYQSTSTGTTSHCNYFWNFGDGYTSTGPATTHAYSSGGGYNVSLTVSDTTCADTVVMSVNVTGAPCAANAGFTMEPAGIPQVWNAIPAYPWNVSSAAWNWGDGSVSNTLYTSHTYSAAGNYSVCLTVILSCGDTATYCAPYYLNRSAGTGSQIILINILPPASIMAGIAAVKAEEEIYAVYPNPSDGEFNLKFNQPGAGPVKLFIHNLVGTTVYEAESDNSAEKTIHLSQLPDGVYFIKAVCGANQYTKKLILSK